MPNRKVKVIGTEINIFGCQNKNIYKALISDIQVIPTGFERWCLDLRLDIDKIDKYFLNAKKSTTHSFTRCFNYEILTKILPTREYLLTVRGKLGSVKSPVTPGVTGTVRRCAPAMFAKK